MSYRNSSTGLLMYKRDAMNPEANGRIHGRIVKDPDSFIVEEITKDGTVLEKGKPFYFSGSDGPFSVFVLEKRAWNTVQALLAISKKLGHGKKAVGFAGTKDRNTTSVQLCSIYGSEPSMLLSLHIKDIKINGAWKSPSGIKMGDLLGNRFTIGIETNDDGALEKANAINERLNGTFPNFFGTQRFGNRGNNVSIGVAMLKGDFEAAAMMFLTDSTGEKNANAIAARERLASERDFSKALSYFPAYLKYERRVLSYLAKYQNYANAMRQLPRQLLLMFVHSVESYIFNEEIRMRIDDFDGVPKCPPNVYGFPDLSSSSATGFPLGNLVGYDTEPNSYEKEILDSLGIKAEDFAMKHMPELNCKGALRPLIAPYKGFSASIDGKRLQLRFSLPSGSYATSLLEQFLQ